MGVRILGATLAGLVVLCGCGEVREVVIDGTSGDGGSSDNGTGGDTTGGSGSHDTGPDQDTEGSTGTTTADTAGSSTGAVPEVEIICVQPMGMIPDDGTWLELVLDVPAGVTTTNMRTSVRIQHPRIADLRVELVAPDERTSALLLDSPSCNGANVQATFDDAAELSVDEACSDDPKAALLGPMRPVQPLAVFASIPGDGTWTVRLRDLETGNEGVIDGICLELEVAS